MSFLENFQDVFSVTGKKVKRTYDLKVLTHKIKGYEKEIKDCYMEIGMALHLSRKEGIALDDQVASSLFENIENMNYRINQLLKQIDAIKKEDYNSQKHFQALPKAETNEAVSIVSDDDKYFKLSMKDDDLKIRRTVEGIKAVRICPSCSSSNDPSIEVCTNCGNVLRTNH